MNRVARNIQTPEMNALRDMETCSTVTQWLARGTGRAGDQAALGYRGERLSYGELDAMSNRLANMLRARGVESGDCIGLCLDRSIEMVASLIGILKLGAAYVPLDPAYPADRLSMMEEDARLRYVLAHSAHAGIFPHCKEKLLIWEKISSEVEAASDGPIDAHIDPETVAYVIFTSGSTGRPKGITMPHRALANLIEWQLERKTFKHGARVLQYSSISFDVSFQEIATTLASGGTLHLIDNDDRKDPRKLLSHLIDHNIERLFLPYVAMRSMIEAAHVVEAYPESLKEIITAGEQLRVDDTVRTFFALIKGSTLDNQYGPSETHVITANLLEGPPSKWPDLPSIGTPIKNCGTYILDDAMHPVVDGEVGELYLAGRNLAHGYIGRDDLTEKVFLNNPFETSLGSRLYRTGDLASYNADGSIAFLGRIDHQIKIRGHRIEPGEINNAASSFHHIEHCLTHAIGGQDGVRQLATYYTVKDGESVDGDALRKHLSKKLPDYMVPSFLIEIDEIPYTPSGKVDLKSLPKPTMANSRYAHSDVFYVTDTEIALAAIWSDLLGLEGIPRCASFFDLGGDSLRAVTMFLRIQQQFGYDLPLATLLEAPTLEALADLIDKRLDQMFPDCRSLKQIQAGAEGQIPLFLVHGGAGNVLCFSQLARNLGADQPVYAFQWPGWDGGAGITRIEKMAHMYTEELLKYFPSGPIRLGGYCLGSHIAIHMARLLREVGIDVLEPLLVFDSPNLKSKSYSPKDPNLEERSRESYNQLSATLATQRLVTHGDEEPLHVSPDVPQGMARLKSTPVYAMARLLRTRLRLFITSFLAQRGRVVPVDGRSWYCGQSNVMAIHHYKNKKYDGDMLYFRSECQGADMLLTGWWNSLYLGFDELCEGRFDAHIIGGRHDRILDHEEVARIIKDRWNTVC